MYRGAVIAAVWVMLAIGTSYSVAGPHGPGGGGGVHGPGGGHGGGGGIHFGGGHEEHEHFGGERERHFWHGRWWGYGEGGCWRPDPYGRYFWICE